MVMFIGAYSNIVLDYALHFSQYERARIHEYNEEGAYSQRLSR